MSYSINNLCVIKSFSIISIQFENRIFFFSFFSLSVFVHLLFIPICCIGAAAYPYWGQAMTYYVPQTMQTQTTAVANNNTTNANSNNTNSNNNNNNNDSNGNKAHIQSPHSIQPHPNTVVKTPLYASNSTNETKSITTPNAASQPNVFQYPPTITSAPTSTSSTSITNSTTTNATNNSVAMTSVQSLPNTSVSVSSSLPTNVGNENPKLLSHVPNAGHPSHR